MKVGKARRIAVAYHQTFGTDSGKVVLHDLMRRCHVCDPIDHDEPNAMAVAEGRRQTVLHILSMLMKPPDQFIKEMNDAGAIYE